jgi:hypothetical protein
MYDDNDYTHYGFSHLAGPDFDPLLWLGNSDDL